MSGPNGATAGGATPNGGTPNGGTPNGAANGAAANGGRGKAPAAVPAQAGGAGQVGQISSQTAAARRPVGFGPRGMMPGGAGEKPLDFKGTARRMFGLLRPERRTMFAVLGFGITSVGLSVAGPKVLGHATDILFSGLTSERVFSLMPPGTTKAEAVELLRQNGQGRLADMLAAMDIVPGRGVDFTAFGRVLAWVLVIYVFASVFGWLQQRLTTHVVQRTAFRLREEVEAKLSRLPLRYFDGQPRGEVLSRATNDTDNIAQSLQQTLSQIITSLLMIIGVLAFMFWISWLLALIALVSVPASIFITARIAKRSQPQFIKQWGTTGKLNGHIEEIYTGHSIVTVFGQHEQAASVFKEHNDALYGSSFKAQFISGLIQPAMFFISNLNYVLVAVVGGLRVASGSLSLGDVQAFIQYSRQFSQPLTAVASMANLIQSGLASAERVFQLLDAPEQTPDPDVPARPDPVRGRVAFENVYFRYDPETPLIEDLSLVVEPGQTVAIVGPTGAGKTTLVNLLMRFYDVTGGRITLDGVDIATMSREELRELVGMVLQDTWLFGGSIEDNLAYGADHPTHDQVVEAAQAAHVDRFVRTLPGGYDTVIDEEGSNVSAGEKQLMTIARAFLAEPTILVLDEATSSVDTRTEVLIQRAMTTLRTGRTSFVIAHRLSTIRNADVILVMEHGQIVEQGTHDSLIAAEGAYARLYQAQFTQAADLA